MVADKKQSDRRYQEVRQENKTMKKEMDKMKKMNKRFQERLDQIELRVICHCGFPSPNSDTTLTSSVRKETRD